MDYKLADRNTRRVGMVWKTEEDQKLKESLSYIVNLRLAWATRDLASTKGTLLN